VVPTPLHPIAEEVQEAKLGIEGNGVVLQQRITQARLDAKRYLKLFKKNVEQNNSYYSVSANLRDIWIKYNGGHLKTFKYSAGSAKALHCLLVSFNNNMVTFMGHIEENDFQPFPDDEYIQLQRTP
jgi:hypothetical protein